MEKQNIFHIKMLMQQSLASLSVCYLYQWEFHSTRKITHLANWKKKQKKNKNWTLKETVEAVYQCFFSHFFFEIPSLMRKSSSMRGIPSRNLILGSQPKSSLAFVMFGFLCRGSSGVLSTVMIFTFGLIICKFSHVRSISDEHVSNFLYNDNRKQFLQLKVSNSERNYLFHSLCELCHCEFTWK